MQERSQRSQRSSQLPNFRVSPGHGTLQVALIARASEAGTADDERSDRKGQKKQTPSLLTSVINEIDIMRALDHPSLLKLYEHFIEGARNKIRAVSHLSVCVALCRGCLPGKRADAGKP